MTAPRFLDADGSAVARGGHDDVLKILKRCGVAASADHVFGAAEFEQASAGFDVAVAHRVDDLGGGDAVALEAIGIEVDLVLACESADGGDVGDTGHGLQMVAQIPILIGAQFGEAVLAGGVDEGVLVDPAEAGGVGAESRSSRLRAAGRERRRGIPRCASGPSRGRCCRRR